MARSILHDGWSWRANIFVSDRQCLGGQVSGDAPSCANGDRVSAVAEDPGHVECHPRQGRHQKRNLQSFRLMLSLFCKRQQHVGSCARHQEAQEKASLRRSFQLSAQPPARFDNGDPLRNNSGTVRTPNSTTRLPWPRGAGQSERATIAQPCCGPSENAPEHPRIRCLARESQSTGL